MHQHARTHKQSISALPLRWIHWSCDGYESFRQCGLQAHSQPLEHQLSDPPAPQSLIHAAAASFVRLIECSINCRQL